MDVRFLLQQLRDAGIDVAPSGTKLRCSGPPGALTPERRELIRTHKPDLLAFLGEAAALAPVASSELLPVQPAGASVPERDSVARFYDYLFHETAHSERYGESGFSNMGYWDGSVSSAIDASRNLVDRLLRPALPVLRKGSRVLDVACGQGGTTKRLSEHCGAATVTAINISPRQVEATRQRVPGCTALVMDATDLHFEDASFDCVLCVEAAFHFNTREAFLSEAARVLKPGGYLVLADILTIPMPYQDVFYPATNFLESIDAYRRLLERCGYSAISIEDHTFSTFLAHSLNLLSNEFRRVQSGAGVERFMGFLLAYTKWNVIYRNYLLVAARKGASKDGRETSMAAL